MTGFLNYSNVPYMSKHQHANLTHTDSPTQDIESETSKCSEQHSPPRLQLSSKISTYIAITNLLDIISKTGAPQLLQYITSKPFIYNFSYL